MIDKRHTLLGAMKTLENTKVFIAGREEKCASSICINSDPDHIIRTGETMLVTSPDGLEHYFWCETFMNRFLGPSNKMGEVQEIIKRHLRKEKLEAIAHRNLASPSSE